MDSNSWKEPFLFQDGSIIKDISGLLAKLRVMDSHTYAHHVNPDKNDFAQWITYSLNEPKLGSFLTKITAKHLIIAALEDYLHHEKPKLNDDPIREYPEHHRQAIHKEEPPFPSMHSEIKNQTTGDVSKFKPSAVQPATPKKEFKPVATPQAETKPAPVEPAKPDFKPSDHDFKPKATQPTQESGIVDPNSVTSMGDQREVVDHIDDDPVITEEEVAEYAQWLSNMQHEVSKVFIGQQEVVHMTIIALLCEAHLLLEGVPGLAKSVLVETLAKTIDGAKFSRIQFIPDLLPSDVIGGQIYNPKSGEFKTVKGPIFAHFVLADEINRAPPKTHAALMEAMAERKINIDKDEFILERPFLVMATQNPLENKGTYELPEAVMDRFMFKVDMDYPERADEKIIITENNTTKAGLRKTVKPVVTRDQILLLQRKVKSVHISSRIREYILNIVEATRGVNKNIEGIKFVKYGAGPRASIALGIAAKSQALMEGRNYVLPKDINAVSKAILRHRVSLNFKGKAYGISSDKIVEEILQKVVEM